MAIAESVMENKQHGPVNGSSVGEETQPGQRPKAVKKISKKSRTETGVPSMRYFLGGDPSGNTPQLMEEHASEVEVVAEAFRRQVSFFVVQEFTVDVQNQNGAPLLRKNPVKDRSS